MSGEAPHAAPGRLDPPYLPIGEHGLIGDLRTAALVGTDGRIDWFCAPRFDSPSVFGALLDAEKGGFWAIEPQCEVATRQQFYFPETNILITRMLTEDGMVEVQDFMPVLREHDPDHRQRLVRRVVSVRGHLRMRVEVAPRPDYGRARHRIEPTATGVRFVGAAPSLTLHSDVALEDRGGDAHGVFRIAQGESVLFVLEPDTESGEGREGSGDSGSVTESAGPADRGRHAVRTGTNTGTGSSDEGGAAAPGRPGAAGDERGPLAPEAAQQLFDATVAFWRGWLARSAYTGRWREMVHRSALALKLLTHEPTGAVVAAPTAALPEHLGGERNWDYRYVWIRDAAFSLYALLRLGFTAEAQAFIAWLSRCLDRSHDGELGPLRVMYTIDGDPRIPEEELHHLAGYRGSRPVRAGNCAAGQLQLDIYGELIDSVYLFNKYGGGVSHDTWTNLGRILDWLLDHWDTPDQGIWETRAGQQHHTYSRVMCWVAVERMIRIANQRGLPADLVRWRRERDAIYRQVMERGWNHDRGTFTQRLADAPGETPPAELDASLLLMPMVKFVSPNDPRFHSTVEAIAEELVTDGLVFRYDPRLTPDGLSGEEGTFSICSFWWVEALTRTGQVERARLALEKIFTYANHTGLYAEQIGLTGEHLGNFPQAFTHLALISAATNLDRSLG
ncbi:glycoside hydrolase family 15 protein [Streptomyces bohaiensis]|uniref:glycoside hydrolase family 15 protein n=1 Tax=Streptomyces bohaiensis TaxID=1431344 RepID=UPI003B7C43F4